MISAISSKLFHMFLGMKNITKIPPRIEFTAKKYIGPP
ncbi:CLUMA_CG017944, isoform A [Clunio marinus]|uniref:CLUMA_CG017944, isoform A n=1 Tax=Clunio marinus TaxID=568069 RepID=A0A1J1IXG4_9DIPT|nr:CLUMA_CG017944, isoform A [Clunio marinus]